MGLIDTTTGLRFGRTLQYQTQIGGGGLVTGAPLNTVLPAITGTPQVGQTLTRTAGTWVGDTPIALAYQWYDDGVAIGGATNTTLVLGAGQQGGLITVVETATADTGAVASATSAAVGPVAA